MLRILWQAVEAPFRALWANPDLIVLALVLFALVLLVGVIALSRR